MDIDLKRLFEANEGKEFEVDEYEFKIIDAKLNVKIYIPIYVNHLGDNILNKIWEVLSSNEQKNKKNSW